MTADDVQIPCVDPRGVLPRHGILITAEVCDSRPLATIPWVDPWGGLPKNAKVQ